MTSNTQARAFTLVEMAMIVFLLLLMATAVVPRLIAIQRSRDLQTLEGRVARLPVEARNAAISSQTPVSLRVNGSELEMEQASADGSTSTLGQVALGTDLRVVALQQNGQPADATTWQWTVYPDGSAENAGMEFAAGTRLQSLLLSARGESLWVPGALTDQPVSQWPVGQAVLRGG